MLVSSENHYEFGDFSLDRDERLLTREGRPVDVTPKAFEILLLLVENAGRTVTKEEIFGRVWPDSYVEETNLSHHIFRLRKTLGDGDETKFIETVPKRGYKFVADVRSAGAAETMSADPIQVRVPDSRRAFPMLPMLVAIAFLILGGWLVYRSGILARDQAQPPLVATSASAPQSITRITTAGKYVATTISPDGKFVSYAQNYSSGEGMLYIRQVETGNERRLLEPTMRNFGSISFSPDGTFVFYIAYEPGDPDGSLYKVPVIGGETTRVLKGVKFMFSLSPDGKQAAFYRYDDQNNQRSIVVASLEGNGEERTLMTMPNAGISSVPAFSPDGKFLSFSYADRGKDFTQPQFGISIIEIATGESRELSDEKWFEIGKTVWAPDGGSLIFPGNRPRTGIQIYSMSYPSGAIRQITNELNYYGNYGMGVTRDGSTIVADLWETQSQLWSIDSSGVTASAEQLTNGISDGAVGLAALPDGQIIYSTRTGEDSDLWILRDVDGMREGKPLTADPSTEAGVCTPHDGSFVVFASDRTGSSHLFRSATDGGDARQLTSGTASEGSPDCMPDGSAVLYNSEGRIWKIPAEGGEPTRLTDFYCIVPSISPDGKFFSCIQPTHQQLTHATVAIVGIEGGVPVKTFEVIPFGFYYRSVRWTPDGKGFVFKLTEKQTGNLWRQDLVGGDPRKITDFKSDVIFNHAYSHDGKRLIVSRGKVAYNTVMLKNFN